MVRSPGFGSRRSDNWPVFQTRFRFSSGKNSLTLPLPLSHRLILQQARGQECIPSHCLSAYGFMFYFTPLWGYFLPFLRSTLSLSVTQEYLALRGGPRRFTRDFTCPMLLGIWQNFTQILTTGLSPSMVQDSAASSLMLLRINIYIYIEWFKF